MDWFFARENGDPNVPGIKGMQDEASANNCSSPEPWLQWVCTESKVSSPSRVCFAHSEKTTEELKVGGQSEWSLSSSGYTSNGRKQSSDEVSWISYANKEDFQSGAHFEQQTSDMGSYHHMISVDLLSPLSSELLFMNLDEEKSSTSHEHGLLVEKKDFHLQYSYQSDDIFQNLAFGGDVPDDKNPVSFPQMSPSVEPSSTQFEKFLSEMLVDSLSLVKDSSLTDGLNCLKASASSEETDNPLDVWEELNIEVSDYPSCLALDLSDSRRTSRASMPTDREEFCEDEIMEEEEGSLEATVLHELEVSMAPLNRKTRICFRDALYRLARNSRPQPAANQTQSSRVVAADVPIPTCGNGSRARELETNVIDRTIANLLFNNAGHDTAQFSLPSHHGKRSAAKSCRRFHSKKRRATHPSIRRMNELSLTTHY